MNKMGLGKKLLFALVILMIIGGIATFLNPEDEIKDTESQTADEIIEINTKWVTIGTWSHETITPDTSMGFEWYNQELQNFSIPENAFEWKVIYVWANGVKDHCTAGVSVKTIDKIASIKDYFKQDLEEGEVIFYFDDEFLTGVYWVKLNTVKVDFNVTIKAKIPIEQKEPIIVRSVKKEWHTYGVYVINPEIQTTGGFSIPNNAEKIKLKFKITYTTASPQYLLSTRILKDGNILWQTGPQYYGSTTIEFVLEDINGDFTLWVLVVLGRAELTVEWYG